jgi:hypothetical protein
MRTTQLELREMIEDIVHKGKSETAVKIQLEVHL